MYTIYVVFTCLPGQREAFVERVYQEGIVEAVRGEEGCVKYDYYFSQKDPNELLLIEFWETKEHQQVHLDQPHMVRLRSLKGEYIATTTLKEFTIG